MLWKLQFVKIEDLSRLKHGISRTDTDSLRRKQPSTSKLCILECPQVFKCGCDKRTSGILVTSVHFTYIHYCCHARYFRLKRKGHLIRSRAAKHSTCMAVNRNSQKVFYKNSTRLKFRHLYHEKSGP